MTDGSDVRAGRRAGARHVALRLGLTLTLVAGAGVIVPGAASAGVAKVIQVTIPGEDGGDPEMVDAPSYTALPGEANRVRVSPGPATSGGGGTVLFEDLGAVVTVGTGCTLLDGHHARCPSDQPAVIDLGDLDDTLSAGNGVDVHASGGSGADHLSGGDGTDRLDGGGGAGDVISGGPGDDTLTDGDGGVNGAPVDADTLDGGPGSDTVSYAGRSATVAVELPDSMTAGQTGEHDHVSSIENATGGHGPDVLGGDAGPNVLSGGPGADRITAAGGADHVDAGSGDDHVSAGDGNDVVTGGQGQDKILLGRGNDVLDDTPERTPTGVDTVSCGLGTDRIRATNTDRDADHLGADCEWFTITENFVDGNIVGDATDSVTASLTATRLTGHVVTVPVRCGRSRHEAACIIAGELQTPGGRRLGRLISRVTLKGGRRGHIRLLVGTAGVRRIQELRAVVLVLAERSHPPHGPELFDPPRARAQFPVPTNVIGIS